ncbi:DNA helicase II [Saccharobesus litoralis]|uniref:DNA 3'-5' helicase n=1 Tax=Saccharobesus litoralis TaxID=2172099 RepID=A0A2S0VQ94_9ALTE|nr:DNA helicase II [Saccharobesus litoralis]AWB66369.1 DNA helicase II [Saccharobesus litoralis]
MDVSYLIDSLNDKQRDAVAAPQQSMLVLAGAGSGKTRVLVHRIAWLMQVEKISPYAIMAVTFTNKAANEMRGRIESLLQTSVNHMWIGTFHGLAHRLLRLHHQDAGLPEGFQILDADDQLRMLKRIIKAMELDDKKWPAKEAMWYINGKKDEGLRPSHIETYNDPVDKVWLQIYKNYQDTCDRGGLVDFAELLLRAHELFLRHPHLLRHYQNRFQHILVDEFQDTNRIQYAWLRILAANPNSNMMIVGDDDQSIYGWRGAKVENLQHFLRDFPEAETIRLEQNYRSTGTILKASNHLIAHNTDRMGKQLWTEAAEGEKIGLYAAFNELDEARFIVGRIKEAFASGTSLAQHAILYRSNAQSRVLEEALISEQIPYKIYGGLRFYERQEIKDALAYLRLINNAQDDAAFERIVNTPARGIGEKSLAQLRSFARQASVPLWHAAKQMLDQGLLKGRAATTVSGFINLVDSIADDISNVPLHRQAEITIKQSGLENMYRAEKGEKAQARLENLGELITACRNFESPDEALSELSAFLSHAALESGENQATKDQDAVQMMTLHTAKGLEFDTVFMTGVEEGMFPSQQSTEESGRMEEERRLCYVGITRAMRKLYISYAESRRLYGRENYHSPSRFIREIPDDCVEEIRLQAKVTKPMSQNSRFSHAKIESAFEETGLYVGQRVEHSKFGEGNVLNYEGSGAQSRVQVAFDDGQTKWLVAAYARLTPLN